MKNILGSIKNILSRSSSNNTTLVQIYAQQGSRRWIVEAKPGDNLMEVLMPGVDQNTHLFGICNKELACLSCSVHTCQKVQEIAKPATNEELDILYTLQDYKEGTTRMSCQIRVTPEMNGMQVEIASANKFIG